MYIDSHCHLNLEQFKDDYRTVIDRAFANNIKAIINVGINFESARQAIEIAEEFGKGIYATVGMHPSEATKETFDETEMTKLAQNKKVVAIGETGLDYFGGNIDKTAQIELMDKQIKLALNINKPIVFHCREAYDDLISHLMSLPQTPRGVIHCYVGDWAHTQVFLEMGFYLSFTGIITFTKNAQLFKTVENIPLDKILIETDAPWLTPEPFRGKRNEPAYVVEVARKIAEIKKIPIDEVEAQTTKNTIDLFKLNNEK